MFQLPKRHLKSEVHNNLLIHAQFSSVQLQLLENRTEFRSNFWISSNVKKKYKTILAYTIKNSIQFKISHLHFTFTLGNEHLLQKSKSTTVTLRFVWLNGNGHFLNIISN